MSNRPSASLVYGIEIDMPKDFEKFDEIVNDDKEITWEIYGDCNIKSNTVILCARSLSCSNYDCYNALGKVLPVATPEHDEMIKDFCKRNGFKFKKPQWFVLGYYG